MGGGQVVDSSTGTVFDSFGLTKPVGWAPRDPQKFQEWRPDRGASKGPVWAKGLWEAAKRTLRLGLGFGGGMASRVLAWGLPHDHLQARIALQAP